MRPPRLPGFDYVGTHAYSLTLCTFRRMSHFHESANVELVHRQILSTARVMEFDILAYCYMPDHLHLLVQGLTARARFKPFVSLAKQRSGYEFKRATEIVLWQPGYFERTLRAEENVEAVAAYIQQNPIRAGLVAALGEWPHVGGRLLENRMGVWTGT